MKNREPKKLHCRGCNKLVPKAQLKIYSLCQKCRAERWGN